MRAVRWMGIGHVALVTRGGRVDGHWSRERARAHLRAASQKRNSSNSSSQKEKGCRARIRERL